MKITATLKNDGFLMEAQNDKGDKVLMDNKTLEGSQGASPMELMLMGLAGCSAIDMLSILRKKRQEVKNYNVTVDGQRPENVVPALFDHIVLTVSLEGEITKENALKAAELSFEKYCSVSMILEKTATIAYQIVLNGEKIK